MKLNTNYNNLKDSYLFSTIAKKVSSFVENNPDKKVIRLGIGDVTLPLSPAIIEATKKATDEMADSATFRGYGEEQGYLFMREAVSKYYNKKGVQLDTDEIFISDGAKSDVGNILDIFDTDNLVLMPNPVYPAYMDTNVMSGRKVELIDGKEENSFLPMPDKNKKCGIIYMCSPNNPTGAVYSKEQLKEWIDYAIANEAVILFDSAYEAFVKETELPSSIYEVEGAKKCAIEFCSLSKTAGFTGTRCGYTVVPKELMINETSLNKLWLRRQTTKFNGVPYIIQRAAEAVFSEDGYKQVMDNISYYMENARIIAETLTEMNIWYVGGDNSPYIWLKCPNNMDSWDFFDYLLENANVVGTPGAGFGTMGEGYFRLTAFGSRENTVEAMSRIRKLEF